MVLWPSVGATAEWYKPLETRREWATDVSGRALGWGHFLPEEAPGGTLAELPAFLGADRT